VHAGHYASGPISSSRTAVFGFGYPWYEPATAIESRPFRLFSFSLLSHFSIFCANRFDRENNRCRESLTFDPALLAARLQGHSALVPGFVFDKNVNNALRIYR
jgi:hypothetical protein